MIQIHDKILPILLQLNRDEVIAYMLINRYLVEGEDIPFDKIVAFISGEGSLTEEDIDDGDGYIFQILKSLEDRGAFIISADPDRGELAKDSLVIEDPINEKSGRIYSEEVALHIYINSKDSINTENNRNKTNKDISTQRKKNTTKKITPEAFTIKFRKSLDKLRNIIVQKDANELVDHFADVQHELYAELDITPKWRKRQFGIAQNLFKDYEYTLTTWSNTINHLAKDKFWKDKLTTLTQVEKQIHQYLAKKGKKKSKTKVRKIK